MAANGPIANGHAPVGAEHRLQYHAFSAEALDSHVHFQVLDLGRQLYIWLGAGDQARLGNIWLAMPGRATAGGTVPPVTGLVRGGPACQGSSLAQRLTMRMGRPVAVAWGLSGSDDALTAWAERRLLQELGNLGLLECNRNNGPSG